MDAVGAQARRLAGATSAHLKALPPWLADMSHSEAKDITYRGLAGAYGLVGLVALVQLIRIQRRVPEFGWTTQKVFHGLNLVCSAARCVVFVMWRTVEVMEPRTVALVLLDLPGLLFFTTYTLLVLFWAEIYHQAKQYSTAALRPSFLVFNAVVYALQAGLWVYSGLHPSEEPSQAELLRRVSSCFLAGVSLLAVIGFAVYGGRLYVMLSRFPIESKGRRTKLLEVGTVTTVCTLCFGARAAMVAFSAFDKHADLDVLDHPLLNAIYYGIVELIPSSSILYVLRKLPARSTRGRSPSPSPSPGY